MCELDRQYVATRVQSGAELQLGGTPRRGVRRCGAGRAAARCPARRPPSAARGLPSSLLRRPGCPLLATHPSASGLSTTFSATRSASAVVAEDIHDYGHSIHCSTTSDPLQYRIISARCFVTALMCLLNTGRHGYRIERFRIMYLLNTGRHGYWAECADLPGLHARHAFSTYSQLTVAS